MSIFLILIVSSILSYESSVKPTHSVVVNVALFLLAAAAAVAAGWLAGRGPLIGGTMSTLCWATGRELDRARSDRRHGEQTRGQRVQHGTHTYAADGLPVTQQKHVTVRNMRVASVTSSYKQQDKTKGVIRFCRFGTLHLYTLIVYCMCFLVSLNNNYIIVKNYSVVNIRTTDI